MTTRNDYSHWNEERDQVWWQEVGRHEEPDSGMSKEDYLEMWAEDQYDEEQ